MIRFEVTGATPEEFAQNAMSAWGLLAIGLQNAMIGAKIATQVEAAVEQASPNGSPPTNGSESSSIASKVHSDKLDDLFASEELGRPVGASAAPSEKPTKTAKNSSKGPKLDDLKTRLSEVIVAATERWDQKRANAYARALLAEFNVAKISELAGADGSFERFMARSQAYLDGTAPE